jgi:hypothetical protein
LPARFYSADPADLVDELREIRARVASAAGRHSAEVAAPTAPLVVRPVTREEKAERIRALVQSALGK